MVLCSYDMFQCYNSMAEVNIIDNVVDPLAYSTLSLYVEYS